MSNTVRQQLFAHLWQGYVGSVPYFKNIFGREKVILDHLAIIDLPSKSSGIPYLKKLFSLLDMHQRGSGYLPEKKNDFIWVQLCESLWVSVALGIYIFDQGCAGIGSVC